MKKTKRVRVTFECVCVLAEESDTIPAALNSKLLDELVEAVARFVEPHPSCRIVAIAPGSRFGARLDFRKVEAKKEPVVRRRTKQRGAK